jgi:hypothetical protein
MATKKARWNDALRMVHDYPEMQVYTVCDQPMLTIQVYTVCDQHMLAIVVYTVCNQHMLTIQVHTVCNVLCFSVGSYFIV